MASIALYCTNGTKLLITARLHNCGNFLIGDGQNLLLRLNDGTILTVSFLKEHVQKLALKLVDFSKCLWQFLLLVGPCGLARDRASEEGLLQASLAKEHLEAFLLGVLGGDVKDLRAILKAVVLHKGHKRQSSVGLVQDHSLLHTMREVHDVELLRPELIRAEDKGILNRGGPSL